MTIRVQDPSPQVDGLAESWAIAEDLMGGTAAMRKGGALHLPKWPNEEQASYAARLATATLFPAFRRTVGVMSGKPFAKALTLGDDVPPKLRDMLDDCDLEGRNLHTFAADLMAHPLAYGMCGVLVDYPETGDQVRTLADEQAVGARPYLVMIHHRQILGWLTEKVQGVTRLAMLRIAENASWPDGAFGVATVNRVRVLRPGSWELWQEGENGEYALISGGVTTLDSIPFVPFYGWRTAFMCGKSPLLDLAYQNVKHWQSQSDQDTLLHVARVPILTARQVGEKFALTVGSSAAVNLGDSPNAELRFVEHSGAAIGAGKEALAALEQQMIQSGAELLVQKPGSRSATEANNDAEANKSDLQRIVEGFEDSLDQVLQFMADWLGLPTGGHVSLFKDFGASNLSDASAQLIIAMQQGGLITKQTAIREQQRRGMLAAEIVPEDELAEVESDGPALGMMDAAMSGGPLPGDAAQADPLAVDPLPAASQSAPAAAQTDFGQLTDAMQGHAQAVHALASKPHPAPAPFDLSPLVEAVKAITDRPEPAITMEMDTAPLAQAIADGFRSVPAPVVNVPQQDMSAVIASMSAMFLEAVKNMPAPVVDVAAPQVTFTPPPPKAGRVKFIEDAQGKIIGAELVETDSATQPHPL